MKGTWCVSLLLCSTIIGATPYGARWCDKDPHLQCLKVKKSETWETLFPDTTQRSIMMRLNRMNIQLHRGMVIAVFKEPPKDAQLLDYSPFKKKIDAPGEKVIMVSLDQDQQAFGAYDTDGHLVYWGPVSGGRGYCPDIKGACHTAVGSFSIYRKEGGGCKSTIFPIGQGGAPMPYCMFFHGGFALHGSFNVPGYNDSHGCVRLFVEDAKWLNENFVRKGEALSVIVKDQKI